ncbi:outer membrane beta-barrel protein [Hymenobacter jeollabukensis]|uniref:PorT family protein n=1 Tax=Hymenobacter jeollabukensis TaxID=2025313 RepID=A0A5R8WU55_9BACT|nr:outer membrane beta-barrel protein [Hymenobacter jeollabukensis]TLM95299.1 PorT family protein [Hymenobacter jeollabukensis]
MKTPLLFTGLLAAGLLTHPAVAQIDIHFQTPGPLKLRYGLRAGGLSTRTTTPTQYIVYDGQAHLYGYQGGIAAEAAWGWLAVQPALVYTQKGHLYDAVTPYTYQGGQYKARRRDELRINYLELPINLVATVHHVQLLAGPYVAWALSGYTKQWSVAEGATPPGATFGTVYRDDLHFGRGHNYRVVDYRRFDAGLNAGLGYQVGPAQVQLTYALGLTDFDYPAPDPANRNPYSGYSGNTINKHRGWQLHATYFFGGKQAE